MSIEIEDAINVIFNESNIGDTLTKAVTILSSCDISSANDALGIAFNNGLVTRLDAGVLKDTIIQLSSSTNLSARDALGIAFRNGLVARLDAGVLKDTIIQLSSSTNLSTHYALEAAFRNGLVERLVAEGVLEDTIIGLSSVNNYSAYHALEAAFRNGLLERRLGFVVDCGAVGVGFNMKGYFLADPTSIDSSSTGLVKGRLVAIGVGCSIFGGVDPIEQVRNHFGLNNLDSVRPELPGRSNTPVLNERVDNGLKVLGSRLSVGL